jgi:hydrogenase expression/formation protein HypC
MCLGIPGQLTSAPCDRPGHAWVDVSGARRMVSVALLEDDAPGPGDWVLIHVGFALAKLDEQEAQATLEMLKGMEQAYTDELEAWSGSATAAGGTGSRAHPEVGRRPGRPGVAGPSGGKA